MNNKQENNVYIRPVINDLDKKRLGRYFGMSLSSPGLPQQIKNIFFLYYAPLPNETWAINNRKESAFFGLTFCCHFDIDIRNLNNNTVRFEDVLYYFYSGKTKNAIINKVSCPDKVEALFRSNMTQTYEYVELIGRILKRADMARTANSLAAPYNKIANINVYALMKDVEGLADITKSGNILNRWANTMMKITVQNETDEVQNEADAMYDI